MNVQRVAGGEIATGITAVNGLMRATERKAGFRFISSSRRGAAPVNKREHIFVCVREDARTDINLGGTANDLKFVPSIGEYSDAWDFFIAERRATE